VRRCEVTCGVGRVTVCCVCAVCVIDLRWVTRTLDVSNNLLSGSLPDTITGFVSLRSLTLSNNLLTGSLPPLNG
jgi:hypothetical protein